MGLWGVDGVVGVAGLRGLSRKTQNEKLILDLFFSGYSPPTANP
eukprot:COSAG02_NODE_2074_length_9929_cov_698.467955_2_plen_44_part_00